MKRRRMKTAQILGTDVAATDYSEAIEWIFQYARTTHHAVAVEAANTHVITMARHDPEFKKVIDQFDLVLPDGMPLVWCLNYRHRHSSTHQLQDRVYGPTLMLKTFEASANQHDLRHFLLGGSPGMLKQLEKNLRAQYPTATITGTYSPPFGTWPNDEFSRIHDKISSATANLVWVGLGCPKQEIWIARNKSQLPPAVYFGIGAAFAFHANMLVQAPSWMQKNGLEWLFRLAKEPKRLAKRYFFYNSLFLFYFLKDFLTRPVNHNTH